MNTQVIKKMFNFKMFFVFGLLLFSFSNAFSAEHCSDQYFIDETLPNGSRWDMCWEHRDREGIVLHHVFYTPKNGARQQILYQASIAQIHVPYDDNGARYHDISDFGIGGSFMNDLTQAECKSGSLKQFSGKNVLCQQIERRYLAHYADSDKLHGDALSLFSNSRVGAYHYLPYWRFFDDGTIEPTMGATGRLQRHTSGHTDEGWPTNSNRTGIAHLHNFFWRLDFDLGTSGTDDFIEEFNFELNSGKRERKTTRFSTEKAREVNPSSYRSWRIIDGGSTNNNVHNKSYEILLEETGHKDKGPSNEPFTHNDFFVTKSNDCEKYASHNPTANDCKKNLAEFVNGENISGQDIIVWVGLTFYHMPRVEDAPHMDAHWNHFQIVPRDWHTVNPLGNGNDGGGSINTAPSITNPGDQASQVGDAVNYLVTATDADNDALNYTATGLPAGLVMNNITERITGTITAEALGTNSVTVTATDGQLSDHASFNWQVTSGGGGGRRNTPPEITGIDDQTNLISDNINLIINATDSDGDTLVYSASGLVPGLVINSSTGVISGIIGADSEGDHVITITANDGTASTSITFKWKISPVSIESSTYQLPSNEWHQLSLPMNPRANNKVSDIFGDDGLGILGVNWVLFRFDGNSNNYVVLGENDELSQGVGYWIIQTTGTTKTLDMPAGSTQALTRACSGGECVEIPLATKEGVEQWNMIGYPFDAQGHLNSARMVTTGSPCSSGCSMIAAETNNISENKLWAYDGSNYVIVDTTNDTLDPWQGFWLSTLSAANGKKPSLVISKP